MTYELEREYLHELARFCSRVSAEIGIGLEALSAFDFEAASHVADELRYLAQRMPPPPAKALIPFSESLVEVVAGTAYLRPSSRQAKCAQDR